MLLIFMRPTIMNQTTPQTVSVLQWPVNCHHHHHHHQPKETTKRTLLSPQMSMARLADLESACIAMRKREMQPEWIAQPHHSWWVVWGGRFCRAYAGRPGKRQAESGWDQDRKASKSDDSLGPMVEEEKMFVSINNHGDPLGSGNLNEQDANACAYIASWSGHFLPPRDLVKRRAPYQIEGRASGNHFDDQRPSSRVGPIFRQASLLTKDSCGSQFFLYSWDTQKYSSL